MEKQQLDGLEKFAKDQHEYDLEHLQHCHHLNSHQKIIGRHEETYRKWRSMIAAEYQWRQAHPLPFNGSVPDDYRDRLLHISQFIKQFPDDETHLTDENKMMFIEDFPSIAQ